MSSEDFVLLALAVLLVGSITTSSYLWAIKKHRKTPLLWASYTVRAVCSLFFFYSVVFIFEVLYGGASLSAVLAFVAPFGLVGVLLATPWGLIFGKRASANKPTQNC